MGARYFQQFRYRWQSMMNILSVGSIVLLLALVGLLYSGLYLRPGRADLYLRV